MTRWKGFRPVRTAAAVVAAGLVIGALSAPTSASAATTSTKYFTAFRETTPTAIASQETSQNGVTPASVMWFDSWATGNAFNVSEAKALWSQGIMPHFTWEPWNTALSVSDANQIHLQDIINGKWDSYIKARGAEFASAGVPILLRWGHEFNGNWYPWGIVNNSSNPALYVSAYRHVHDLVVAAGATNVQWVWCFANGSVPVASYNDPAQSYPGDAYVDWVAFDGYNWGLAPSWDPAGNYWTSFNTMFASAYATARAIAPKRPVMIAETASSEDGGSKAAWINDMNTQLQSGSYPDLKVITWFDQNKEELWSAASSSASLSAFLSWVKQPYLNGTGTDLAQVAAQYKGTTTTTTTTRPTTTTTTTRPTTTTTTTRPTTTTTTTTTRATTTTTPTGGSKSCAASVSVPSAWAGGFVANVTVTAGSSAITAWKVTLSVPSGAAITNGWNAVFSGTTGSVTATNQSYNGSLGAGGSASFGFQGTGSATGITATCSAG